MNVAKARPNKPKAKGLEAEKVVSERPPTEVIRIPADLFEMIDTAAQHYHTSAAGILTRDDCPLRGWLERVYEVVIAEKQAIMQARKKAGE